MYAVIKTGGKQYRVQPGDVLVVEKLDGDVGASVKFDQVLLHGEGGEVTLGAPVIEGAAVHATLIETRKGEKVKIFKKIRRQGYRRTRGHRQTETVLRVTGLEIGGKTTTWDGTVDLTPKALLDARARGLKNEIARLEGLHGAHAALAAGVVDEQEAANEAPAPAPKKARAAAAPVEAEVAPVAEVTAATLEAEGVVDEQAAADEAPAPKKSRAKKAQAASDAGEDA